MLYVLKRATEDDSIIWIEDETGKFFCSFWRLDSTGHQVPEPNAKDAEANARLACQKLNKADSK